MRGSDGTFVQASRLPADYAGNRVIVLLPGDFTGAVSHFAQGRWRFGVVVQHRFLTRESREAPWIDIDTGAVHDSEEQIIGYIKKTSGYAETCPSPGYFPSARAPHTARSRLMGTRADFYVGRGPDAEWIGSIAYNGGPGRYPAILRARTEADFRAAVAAELAGRNDATVPERGWPWPWGNSSTTDYGYCFKRVQEDDPVPCSVAAEELPGQHVRWEGQHVWWESPYHMVGDACKERPTPVWVNEREDEDTSEPVVWPDMRARKNVRIDEGSGLLLLGGPR